MIGIILVLLAARVALGADAARRRSATDVVDEIRTEALRLSNDSSGRPLPLASHWNCGDPPEGLPPNYWLHWLDDGRHILPWFMLPKPEQSATPAQLAYYDRALRRCAQLKLPISFISAQWEHYLSKPPYLGLPAEKNPNTVLADGTIKPEVSPMGAVAPWREMGPKWMKSPLMLRLQQLYPDPPMVLFVSDNEQPRLMWSDAEKDVRFVRAYGKGKSAEERRKIFAERWVVPYRAMILSMRASLANDTWRAASRFIGYEAFGPPFMGRWEGWDQFAYHVPGRIDPAPIIWDGATPSYYTHDWNSIADYKAYSPQIESMNWIFMQRAALAENPRFWFEISVWDGHEPTLAKDKRAQYAAAGQSFSPARYGGYVQFGMWLLRPRAVREFRGTMAKRAEDVPFFEKILDAVDRVYANATLTDFWRHAELVPNHAHTHHYDKNVPAEFAKQDRWFLLDTTLDPPRPWALETEIPVFSLALVKGRAPRRQWLVYAHSPLRDRQGVEVTVPGYGNTKIDVTQDGVFHLLDEGKGTCLKVE
ncbi:MAG TPA: hypothetical protein VF669_13005 [Tepidisphaeraceae bacterium]|jgi:hypothetical protein